ncbi:acetyltransferase [Pseudomonas asplenii]|uniref:Acetyltransferase n=1 Tax=Pseudomonas asplenii TaxID=53407 RepID=A0A0N0E4W5_9PSED|nr:GNAT family N-acetyltransferase [Pseudomonas fuscovaginae]KPA91774.1 acetyltransferase [Pseudomonas fuscovaginae]
MNIIPYTLDHHEGVMDLMRRTPGIVVRDTDSKSATARYLTRNPNLSFLCVDQGRIVGCAMCGHDGRRGYLQHVVVEEAHRGQGIANTLVERCLVELEKIGIYKTHLDVLVENTEAQEYWARRGWQKRDDIGRYSIIRSGNQNA